MRKTVSMDYDPSGIGVLPGLEAVRKRPRMYFGCEQEDPALPCRVLQSTVNSVLREPWDEPPSRRPRWVKVTVVDDRRFRIEDNDEPEWVLSQRDTSVDELLARVLTVVHVGGWARWGVGMPISVAMCSEVVAEVRIDGRRYRQRVTPSKPPGPAKVLGPAGEAAHLVDFRLDAAYLPATSTLPVEPAAALIEILQRDPPPDGFGPRLAPPVGTRLEVHDLRSSAVLVAHRDH
jgi:DNA gyrase subunit B